MKHPVVHSMPVQDCFYGTADVNGIIGARPIKIPARMMGVGHQNRGRCKSGFYYFFSLS